MAVVSDQQAVEFDADRTNEIRMVFADFLQPQFGVQTMANFGWRFGRRRPTTARRTPAAPSPLTRWARTRPSPGWPPASSASSCPTSSTSSRSISTWPTSRRRGPGADALNHLAQIFENRRQYPKAADSGGGAQQYPNDAGAGQRFLQAAGKHELEQIVGNWGRFEPVRRSRPARGPRSTSASATATRSPSRPTTIKVAKLLDDVKAYLKSNPGQLDWQNGEHRRHRLSPGRTEPEAVPRREGRRLGSGP